jgi:hypothetical protein
MFPKPVLFCVFLLDLLVILWETPKWDWNCLEADGGLRQRTMHGTHHFLQGLPTANSCLSHQKHVVCNS